MSRAATDSQRDTARLHLHRAWVEKLYDEYEYLVYQHSAGGLFVPVIDVVTTVSRWAAWNPNARVISISEKLIREHPWHVVVEVLKHEMAHQYAHEVLGGGDAHGACFQHACDLFAVEPWARTSTGELPRTIPDWRRDHPTEEEARLLRRVDKLLALATSSNEHEALSAMKRVQELYSRYNVERIRQRRTAEHVYLRLHTKLKRLGVEHRSIAGILNSHFFVRTLILSEYNAFDRCAYRAIELAGTRENVLMAEYVYHFLLRSLSAGWKQYRETTSDRRAATRNNFYRGVLRGFHTKLAEESRARNASASREDRRLMKIGDAAVREYLSRRYPRTSPLSGRYQIRDRAAFEAGSRAGRELTIQKPVSAGDENRGLLLGE